MSKTYLFDWGNTLMVDFPNQKGKMCHWKKVEATSGALEALKSISSHSPVYIATNAADSTEAEIETAFEKVGLSSFISGYFCKGNIGIGKGSKEFYLTIAHVLNTKPSDLIMVGDSLENDIIPAIEAGVTAIWLNSKNSQPPTIACQRIAGLNELCKKLDTMALL
ncbi:MAG: HAD family hydrolase [Aliiglaciecola sp.]|uniref:HAD family hydrolase n=1 Tax=Aliiglaciecola sp. TaxID=1872441 RepID=UPI003296DA23